MAFKWGTMFEGKKNLNNPKIVHLGFYAPELLFGSEGAFQLK
jgi:hypothetical protein